MKIVGEVKGYIIHKTDSGNHFLCKILKESKIFSYDST